MALYGTGSAPKTELLINNVWTDLSSKPRAEQKIVITRGRANEQGFVTAQTCSTSVNNRDGLLSNRNPNSIYYGLLPRNTPLRITAGGGDNYLKAPYTDSTAIAGMTTQDKASLHIVGDIDLRCEVQPYRWRGTVGMMLMSKYDVGGNQRDWALYVDGQGYLILVWSTDGTAAGRIFATSTVPVPATSGRLAIKATLDVNNGAAGNTTTFATSTAIGGTYTQLGATVVKAGVTSIFGGTANPVLGGGGDDFQIPIGGLVGFGGRFYKGEIRNGLAGTLVANMDATAQAVGTGSWSDGLTSPNTWVRGGVNVRITTDRIRFYGELSSLPQVWDITGTDVYVPVTASGIIRRLTQGASPIQSAMVRNFTQYNASGYWALEDGTAARSAASLVASGKPAQATNVVFGASTSGLPGAASAAQFVDSTSNLLFSASKVASTGTISFVFYTKLSALPATQKILVNLYTTGTARRIAISMTATTWNIEFFALDGTSLATGSTAVTNIDPSKGWIGYNLLLQTSGANMTFSIRWDAISGFGGGVGPTSIATATVGVPVSALIQPSATDPAFNDALLSSVFMSTQNLDLTNDSFRKASSAWLGETAVARVIRLALEEGETIETIGIASESEVMGYQTVDTFMNLLYDCADTDGGILSECRDRLAIQYRSRTALEGRSDVTLDYALSHLDAVPLPTEDDQAFTNDVTVSRPDGTSARVQVTDGATSVSPPPAGVGRYSTSISRNVGTEARLPSVAGWAALVGSWDDARYPSLSVGLHRTEITGDATLTGQVIALELGDTAVLAHLPAWLPPDNVPELIQGYTETLDKFTWTIKVNASPAAPYQGAAVLGSDALPVRLDATGHTSNSFRTAVATSFSFATPAGSALWVTTAVNPAEFPFDVKIGGERMTVTAITGTSSPQTATVTRSVNGIVKTQAADQLVRLAVPFYVGR